MLRKNLLYLSMVLACTAPWGAAQANPTDILRSELAKNPAAGKILKTFNAQGGLTGVVLQTPNGQKLICYLTPDGRYMIAGAVIDLSNGENLTAIAAQKEIGPSAVPNAKDSAQAIYTLGQMQGIVFGNPSATSYLAVVVDPSTIKGRAILIETMQEAVNLHESGQDKFEQIRFYPYGPVASRLLAGSNVQQLKNLLTFVEGKPLPEPTASSKAFAQRNTQAAARMAVKPPAMIVFDPNSQFTRAISLEKTDMSPNLLQGLAALQQSLAAPAK